MLLELVVTAAVQKLLAFIQLNFREEMNLSMSFSENRINLLFSVLLLLILLVVVVIVVVVAVVVVAVVAVVVVLVVDRDRWFIYSKKLQPKLS